MIKKATRENVVPGVFFVISDSSDSCQLYRPNFVTKVDGDRVYCRTYGRQNDGEIVLISQLESSEYFCFIRFVSEDLEEMFRFIDRAHASAQETENKCRKLWRETFEKLCHDEGISL